MESTLAALFNPEAFERSSFQEEMGLSPSFTQPGIA
jgi:hypothetical protein